MTFSDTRHWPGDFHRASVRPASRPAPEFRFSATWAKDRRFFVLRFRQYRGAKPRTDTREPLHQPQRLSPEHQRPVPFWANVAVLTFPGRHGIFPSDQFFVVGRLTLHIPPGLYGRHHGHLRFSCRREDPFSRHKPTCAPEGAGHLPVPGPHPSGWRAFSFNRAPMAER